MVENKKPRRPYGSVKHLVSVCQSVGMTLDEVHFGTGISKDQLRWTAKYIKVKFRNPNNPLIKYYAE